MEVELKGAERIDDLERNGYRIIQDPGGFCFGMDAVLLSGFVPSNVTGRAIDLGTGTGIIPILLRAKTKLRDLTGLEIQEKFCDMAERSVRLNDLEDDIHIVQGDIRNAAELFDRGSFDVVTSNPPYMKPEGGIVNPDSSKAVARTLTTHNKELNHGRKPVSMR